MKNKKMYAIRTIITILVLVSVGVFSKCYSQKFVSLTKQNGVYTLPCKINGFEIEFYFDTGASTVSISQDIANSLFANKYLDSTDVIGFQELIDATGKKTKVKLILIKKMRIGDIAIDNVIGSIMPYSNSPLLLGQSALEKISPFQIDYENLRLIFPSKNTNQKEGQKIETQQPFYLDNQYEVYRNLIKKILSVPVEIASADTISSPFNEDFDGNNQQDVNEIDNKKLWLDSAYLLYKSNKMIQQNDSLALVLFLEIGRYRYGDKGLLYDDNFREKALLTALYHDKKKLHANELNYYLYLLYNSGDRKDNILSDATEKSIINSTTHDYFFKEMLFNLALKAQIEEKYLLELRYLTLLHKSRAKFAIPYEKIRLLTRKAELNIKLENYFSAIADLTELIAYSLRFKKANYIYYANRAHAYSKLNKSILALEDYNKALQLKKDDCLIFYHRALLNIKLKRNHDACTDLSKSIELGCSEALNVNRDFCK